MLHLKKTRIAADFKYQLRHNQSIRNWTPDIGFSPDISDSHADTFPYRSRFALGSNKQFLFLAMNNKQDSLNDSVRPSGGCDRDIGYYLAIHPSHDYPTYLQFRMHVGPLSSFHTIVNPRVMKAIPQIRNYAVSK